MPCEYCFGLLLQNPQFLGNEIRHEAIITGNKNVYAAAYSFLEKLGIPKSERDILIIVAAPHIL